MIDTKAIARKNLLSLLEAKEGSLGPSENGTSRLAKLAGKKTSWGQRLLDDTDIGLQVLTEAAAMFKLEPWQLLVPGLTPKHPPQLAGDDSAWPFERVDAAAYRSLGPEDRAWVQAKLDTAIEQRLDAQRRREPTARPDRTHPESAPAKRTGIAG